MGVLAFELSRPSMKIFCVLSASSCEGQPDVLELKCPNTHLKIFITSFKHTHTRIFISELAVEFTEPKTEIACWALLFLHPH